VSEAVLAVLEGPLVALDIDIYDTSEWKALAADYRLDASAAEALTQRWPWIRPWMNVMTALLGWECKPFAKDWLDTASVEYRFGASPPADQTTLREAVAD
jgi:hypothetical protein